MTPRRRRRIDWTLVSLSGGGDTLVQWTPAMKCGVIVFVARPRWEDETDDQAHARSHDHRAGAVRCRGCTVWQQHVRADRSGSVPARPGDPAHRDGAAR